MTNEQPALSKEHVYLITQWLEAQRRARLKESSDVERTKVLSDNKHDDVTYTRTQG